MMYVRLTYSNTLSAGQDASMTSAVCVLVVRCLCSEWIVFLISVVRSCRIKTPADRPVTQIVNDECHARAPTHSSRANEGSLIRRRECYDLHLMIGYYKPS